MAITRLENLLKSGPGDDLDKLVQRAQQMGELTHILQAALDPQLASSLKAANLRENGELVLICESSNWAARLRFEGEKLMKAARSTGRTVNSCRVAITRNV